MYFFDAFPRLAAEYGAMYACARAELDLFYGTLPLVASWSLGVVALAGLSFKSRRRRFWSRPGVLAAGLIGLIGMVATVPSDVVRACVIPGTGFPTVELGWLLSASAVASAWLTLGLNRRRRPDGTWPDWAGYVLGGFTIAHGALILLVLQFKLLS